MSHSLYHFEDAETLAAAAAERWRAALLARDPNRPFTVALSGGRIPKALYKAFAGLAAGDSLELSLIHISEPTRRTPISYAVFCLKKKKHQ